MSQSPAGGGAGEMNTAPFSTTNPFETDLQNNSNQSGSNAGGTSSVGDEGGIRDHVHEGGRSTAVNKVRFASEDKIDPEDGDGTVGDKADVSAGDITAGVVEKLKTAANRFHLHDIKATGPSKLFNPTSVRMHISWKGNEDQDGNGGTGAIKPADLAVLWRSRDNRKGRNSIVVPRYAYKEPQSHNPFVHTPEFTSSVKAVGKNLIRMFTTFPYWDMAFWSGWSYTVGSALFVIDGAFGWSPLAFPGDEFKGESTYGVPLCFFLGALFYQIGAVMAYLEAVNDGSFHGSAMRRLMEGHEDDQKQMLDEKIHGFFDHMMPHPHKHEDEEKAEKVAYSVDPEAGWRTKHRRERPGSIYPAGKAPAPRRGGVDLGEAEEGDSSTYMSWRWWPSWQALRTHHVYEIGYLACAIQLFGVTLYGMTAIVILPGVFDSLNPWQELAAYWVPQMVAAACFLIASLMFMFETQERWWKPEPKVMGWWIGVWSTIGSVGFELCAAFGPTSRTQDWAEYQSDLSSMWGSAAYLFGSFLQWYEALNKRPVEELFNEPGEMKSYMVRL